MAIAQTTLEAPGRSCLPEAGPGAILISGCVGDQDAMRGFDAVLAKPCLLEALREAVARQLDRCRG